jgi:hypothetical protein
MIQNVGVNYAVNRVLNKTGGNSDLYADTYRLDCWLREKLIAHD